MNILVTGGAGFIGSGFIRYMLEHHDDVHIVNFDALTYAGNLQNVAAVQDNPRYRFVRGDITNPEEVAAALEGIDTIVHFAAESHNDRSVLDPAIFFRTNVLGTQVLLEAARRADIKRFHHISTDEVFGDLGLDEDRAFRENDVLAPRSPYSASKAGAVHAVMAYHHTFGLPVTISHCCNNYGPYQFPEKLIPLFTTNALQDLPLPMFKSKNNRREWIHVDDHSAAVALILERGQIGHAYNIGTGVEKSIEEVADLILSTLDKPASLKTIVADRLGHDRRYAIDSSKIRNQLGWQPLISFEDGLRDTIAWYQHNEAWWKAVKSGAYQQYYQDYYGGLATNVADSL